MIVESASRYPMASDTTTVDVGRTLHGTTEELTRSAESGQDLNPTLDGLPHQEELEALLAGVNIVIPGFQAKTKNGELLSEEELLRYSRDNIVQYGQSLVQTFGEDKAEDYIRRQARRYTLVEEKPV